MGPTLGSPGPGMTRETKPIIGRETTIRQKVLNYTSPPHYAAKWFHPIELTKTWRQLCPQRKRHLEYQCSNSAQYPTDQESLPVGHCTFPEVFISIQDPPLPQVTNHSNHPCWQTGDLTGRAVLSTQSSWAPQVGTEVCVASMGCQ